jgi:glycosyltransferase involved in cell wall biosynthesis
MVGATPNQSIYSVCHRSPYKKDIFLLSGKDDEFLKNAYAGASVLLYPSLAEGFGWPIAEAMASGCPVITTDEAPMTEVGGKAAFYIPRMPLNYKDKQDWLKNAALLLEKVLNLNEKDKKRVVDVGIENVKRFDPQKALDKIEEIYKHVFNWHN